MSEAESTVHPPSLRALCERAIRALRAIEAAPPTERAAPLRAASTAMRELDSEVKRLDLGKALFNDEQGDLIAAASALAAIELDRAGPRVPRYIETAAEALERIAAM